MRRFLRSLPDSLNLDVGGPSAAGESNSGKILAQANIKELK
jgi:hypothetical protein